MFRDGRDICDAAMLALTNFLSEASVFSTAGICHPATYAAQLIWSALVQDATTHESNVFAMRFYCFLLCNT